VGHAMIPAAPPKTSLRARIALQPFTERRFHGQLSEWLSRQAEGIIRDNPDGSKPPTMTAAELPWLLGAGCQPVPATTNPKI
jgi:hypothetical protein